MGNSLKDLDLNSEIGGNLIVFKVAFFSNFHDQKRFLFVTKYKGRKKYKVYYGTDGVGCTLIGQYPKLSASINRCWRIIKKKVNLNHK